MSKNIQQSTKKLYLNNQNKYKKGLKKKAKSQIKYSSIPDIMTQAKPYTNNIDNIINQSDSHKTALTPNNHSKIIKELLLPEKSSEFINKKTLILDLDETLVHSSFTPFEKNDIILNVDFDGVLYKIYVLVRPGVEYFIKNISKYYELIIFTASLSNYASPLLDILDKDNNIKYRLYRENCTFMNGIYIKELKKLNRDLKDLIIVDNSPLAYTLDNDNGLPIKTWYDDKNDVELYKINSILEFLAKTEDVRKYIKQFVRRNEIIYEDAMNLIKNIKDKNINNKSHMNKNLNLSNLNNTNNNENNTTSFINNISSSKNNIKGLNNIDDNIYFNIEPIKFNNLNNIKENKNIFESEKNIVKYKLDKENQKKTLKASILYNSQNKNSKIFLFNNNNNLRKNKDNFYENKKTNKNNNYFRLKRKNEIKQNYNAILNINKNAKISPILPMTLSTKDIKGFFFNTTKNLLLKQNKISKPNENDIIMKNNYINIIKDKKEKNKYTNLLRQINNDNIKNNSENKNNIKYEKYGLNNLHKSKKRISSSFVRNYTPLNINKSNRLYFSFNVQRSKSTEHFFDKPKTQNRQNIINNEKRKFNNLLGGIYLVNTPRYDNIPNYYLNNNYKYKRIQTAKKIMINRENIFNA